MSNVTSAKLACLFLATLALVPGCADRSASSDTNPDATELESEISGSSEKPTASQSADYAFEEVSSESGFEFQNLSGRTLEYRFFEIVGTGAALFDFDNDGDLDVYVVQSHEGPVLTKGSTSDTPSDRLYRNDTAGSGPNVELKFTDVTVSSGVSVATGYGQGVACGDIDNDGDVDVFVTNVGGNQFLINNGDGTFSDATKAVGLQSDRWSTSACFVDFDRDGWLDLFVSNYVIYSAESQKPCYGASGRRDYCGPNSYTGEADQLYRNDGTGRFIDVSVKAGIASKYGAGLGIVSADFNGDHWPDIYVANDGMENRLWINGKDGTFEDAALLFGCAFNAVGAAEAGMGVDAGDFDNDGDEDIFVAHLTSETNTLYLNDGSGGFSDRTNLLGLAAPSQAMTSFGSGWLDFDNDSRLDLVVVSGTVKRENGTVTTSQDYPLGQHNQLFHNEGDRFVEAKRRVAPSFEQQEMSRGLSMGDIDNDGDMDFIVINNEGPARMYRNQLGHQQNWTGVRLVDASGRRDQLGAVARLTLSSGVTMQRRCRADGSYCSAHDPRVLFAVPDGAKATNLTVRWPDGTIEQFPAPTLRQYNTLRQGTGQQL
ncbi:CRTAC1 family protein [Rhodopirellula sp. MGV]|uniref:CRTAC1 family protein n=1 Tax=Rhodopirellula sp. MGV TaxID=2023130 RepID=UPI00130475A7|nr:CRTAC1 family protein [Rhodopirellula sp. MGV]